MESRRGRPQHYAFLVTDDEFGAVRDGCASAGSRHWADPGTARRGRTATTAGAGLYFDSPEGHNLEIITRP